MQPVISGTSAATNKLMKPRLATRGLQNLMDFLFIEKEKNYGEI